MLDFRNNKIKKRSTLDSIIERMSIMSISHPVSDALVAAEMPVNPEPRPRPIPIEPVEMLGS